MNQLRIFVSHSSQDKAIADQFVHGLRAAGADVWYDEHNLGAGHLKNEIQRELARRPIFIVLLSKAAFASAWVKRETDWADELDDRDPTRLMLPVTIGPIERDDFSGETGWLFLHSYKRIEAPGYHPYSAAETLERTLRTLGLTPEGAVPPSSQPQPQESVDDLLARAKAFIAQKQYAEAFPFLERMTKQAPQRFDGWANLGLAAIETQRYEEALHACERALALDAAQSWVWYNKGVALHSLKRYEEALTTYEQALTLDPTRANAWYGKGDVLYELKRYEEVVAACEQALKLDPTNTLAWYDKGLALRNLKRNEEAVDAYEQALKLDPSNVLAWRNKAYPLRALGRNSEAEAAERQAQALER